MKINGKVQRPILFLVIIGVVCLFPITTVSAQHPEVQIIYFQASDVDPPTEKDFEAITETMKNVQDFYQKQMIRHGHGPKTFAFECKIHLVKGSRPLAEYNKVDVNTGMDRIEADFHRRVLMEFGERENIQIIFLAGAKRLENDRLSGTAFTGCQDNGCLYWSLITVGNPNVIDLIAAHELGHNFGLDHIEKPNLLMNPQIADEGLPRTLAQFSIEAQEAEILSKHPFFHDVPIPEIQITEPQPPKNPILSISNVSKAVYLWGQLKRKRE